MEATVIAAPVKSALGERVADVRSSQRLTDSAACLVAGGHGPDRELERLLARSGRGGGGKPILELNMRHALVKALGAAKTQGREEDVDRDLGRRSCSIRPRSWTARVPSDPEAAFSARELRTGWWCAACQRRAE